MCGIFSLLSWGTPIGLDEHSIMREFNKIKHRGPDDTSSLAVKDAFLGFHRLSINGLNTSSNQPLEYNGVYLICNGEIFNYKELISSHNLEVKTGSDCEVILHLYYKYGIDRTIKMLDGEFAFCLYDTTINVFYVGRDHIGIRPLFIGKNNDSGIYGFASEAKALTNIFTDVRQYLPGRYTIFNLGTRVYNTVKWYNYISMSTEVVPELDYQNMSREDILLKVKNLLLQSVYLRAYTSERPVGTFLSGGLDSSLVTSIVSKIYPDIHCFSIGMEGSVDLKASIKVAQYLNLTNHHVVKVTLDDVLLAIPQVIKTLETYDITTIRASTYQWLLSKYIAENTDVKVLLSGEVPDESIPGYWAFSFCDSDDDFKKLSQTMIEELHEYDLLRTDRTTANFGLEVRVPFADKKLLELFHNINVKYRRFGGVGEYKSTIEKSLLRDAFNGDYLPKSILYRKKHAFSDAVDGTNVCSHKEVEKFAATVVSDEDWNNRAMLYPVNTPVSREAFYYRQIFEQFYNGRSQLLTKFWLPQIRDSDGNLITNPSATALPGHTIDTNF